MNMDIDSKESRQRLAQAMGAISGACHIEEYEQIISLLEKHMIPERYPAIANTLLSGRELDWDATAYRNTIIQKCGYALIAYEWIRPLAQWIGNRRCLEIMAGSGALSFALSQCGVDIVATDDKSWTDPRCNWFPAPWSDVVQMDCLQAIQKYGKERAIIICSWPYMDDSAYRSLLEMRRVNPDAVMLYIGENWGGATANDDFFENLSLVEDDDFSAAVQNFKQMPGLHDFPMLVK